MKKIILIIGIAFLSSSCSKKLYNVEKAVTVPVIDGDQTEWPVNTIRSNNNINYAIQQDQDNLYLMVSSFDEQIMKKIMLLGMTYWVSTEGKHSKDQGISFPEGIVNSDAIKQKFKSLILLLRYCFQFVLRICISFQQVLYPISLVFF